MACRRGSRACPRAEPVRQTINFTVAANTGPARSANIVIEGQTFAVSQANGCTYTLLSPGQPHLRALRIAGEETSPSRRVRVAPGPPRRASRWITIVSGGSGTGSGTIRIQLRRISGSASTDGNVTVGGQTVNITQTFP